MTKGVLSQLIAYGEPDISFSKPYILFTKEEKKRHIAKLNRPLDVQSYTQMVLFYIVYSPFITIDVIVKGLTSVRNIISTINSFIFFA